MQFIEELTLVHKVAILATIGLIMVLLLVSARRRKAAAAPSDANATPAKPSRRRGRAKSEQALPRRKRRKLAAEAAHSMGVDTPAASLAPEVSSVHIPEVAEAAPLEPSVDQAIEAAVAEPLPVEPVPVVPSDDPYLHDAAMGDVGAFVAQPGWPSPGELASSFDPDAFDPLPEVHQPQHEELTYDESEAVEYDDTNALDLAAVSTADEVSALEEIEEWADTLGTESTWDDADESDLSAGTWTIAEELQPEVVAAASDPEPMDLEDIWSDPDDEPLWNQPALTVPVDQDVVDLETALTDDPAFDVIDAEEPVAVADDTNVDVLPNAWADETPPAWNTVDTPEPSASPTASPAWSGGIGGHNSPVVLDLAGLAAWGQSLELIIEPNADGHGVRLRFGAPATTVVEQPMFPRAVLGDASPLLGEDADTVATLDTESEVTSVDEAVSGSTIADVPFLAGIAPVEVSPQVVEPTEPPAPAVVAIEPEHVPVQTHDVVDTDVSEQFEPVASDPMATYADHGPVAPFDASAFGQSDEFAYDSETAAPATAVMDPSDDPARILADIRARLAALDAQR